MNQTNLLLLVDDAISYLSAAFPFSIGKNEAQVQVRSYRDRILDAR